MSEKLAEEIRKAVRDEVSRVLTNPKEEKKDSSAPNESKNTPGPSTSASTNTTMTFEEFYKKREKMRQGDFKTGKSGKRQKLAVKEVKDIDVEIKVCIASQQDGVIKARRGKSQIVRVKSSSTKEDLLMKAIEKHTLFDQSFDNADTYTLLYPDFTEVNIIPGTSAKPFTLAGYKEASGKDYKRLTFYMISSDEFFVQRDVIDVVSDDSCPPSPPPASAVKVDRSIKQSCRVGSPSTSKDAGRSFKNEFKVEKSEWAPWRMDCSDSGCSEDDDEILEYVIQASKDEAAIQASKDEAAIQASKEALEASPKSLLEALKKILQGYDAADYTSIEITRKNIVSKTFELLEDEVIKARIIVQFIGEEGVDTGGVTREFFSEFFNGLTAASEIVRGTYPNLTFRHNLTALREGRFETLGTLIAVALINDCPGPHCFSVLLVNALFDIDSSVSISLSEVPQECEYLHQLKKIDDSTDEESFSRSVMEFPERFDLGYTKAIVSVKDKQDLIDMCVRHIIVSSIAEELFSFRKGLGSFGVYEALCKFQDEALKQFVFTEVSLEEVKSCFEPVFSENASEREMETEVVYSWNQFLKATSKGVLKGTVTNYDSFDDISEQRVLKLEDILQFGSGSRYPNFKGGLLFDHNISESCRRVKASTCAFQITIPINKRYCCSAKEFSNNFMEDIFDTRGFGFA